MNDATKEMIKLSWQILEHKCRYYRQELNLTTIPDEEYDKIEDRYRILCEELKISPTACDMVDFDMSRPSCNLVYKKLKGRK